MTYNGDDIDCPNLADHDSRFLTGEHSDATNVEPNSRNQGAAAMAWFKLAKNVMRVPPRPPAVPTARRIVICVTRNVTSTQARAPSAVTTSSMQVGRSATTETRS